jgi:hypothetical protein
MFNVGPTFMVGRGLSPQKAQPGQTQNTLRLMDKPPKLWRLLVMLAAVIAAIVWLNHYAATLPGAK